MRVYGSSPLYNYVELVFRSKRLFIASIVLATLVTVSIAAMRAGTYTASALVLLSGNTQTGPQTFDDAGQQGSIKYKLNVLNIVMKDPEFIKTAFREAGLDRNRTDEQFDLFCKEARAALSYATGENVLEINCHWKDAQAADIINAFYNAYSNRVLDQETVLSTQTTNMIRTLLDEYTLKEKDIEKKVIAFRERSVGKPVDEADFGGANSLYDQDQVRVKFLKDQVATMEKSLVLGQQMLAKMPQNITESLTREGLARSPQYQALVLRQQELETKLADLKTKYTDSDPRVKQYAEQRDAIKSQIAQMNTDDPKQIQKGPIATQRQTINPQWSNLSNQITALKFHLQEARDQLMEQTANLEIDRQRAVGAPKVLYQFKWMTDNLNRYASIRQNLASRLEAAKMDEKRDRELHLAEMTMMVRPQAEPEVVGAKSLMFYAAGPILGFLIAFAFSLLAETLDHSLRTPIEVENFLGKPVLAVLPRIDSPKDPSRRRLGGGGETARSSLPSS